MRKLFLLLIGIVFIMACGTKQSVVVPIIDCPDFSIQNFTPIGNYQPDSLSHKTIYLDYDNALNGFTIPSVQQIKGGLFQLSFQLKNKTSQATQFYYKIYYQNESYKFNELDSATQTEHVFAEENFYGSWEQSDIGFKPTSSIAADNTFHLVTDSFRIVGNPRNEQRYFSKGKNDRWKRNPRVGNYSFLLVVSTKDDTVQIPKTIQHIGLQKGSHFENPYFYFLYGAGKNAKGTVASKSNLALKVVANPNLGAGIYVNDKIFQNKTYDKSYFCKTCGQDSSIYKNAAIQQFINYVDASSKLYNIPVLADVQNNYSKMDYNWNATFYTKEELIPTVIQTSQHPCQTVTSDAVNKKITLRNPASKPGEWKKESVGIITRHGFTYGKFRVKVKLTELLNKDNVWNGITNAMWLITQGGGEWNFRRNCGNEGYMSTYWGGPNDKRVKAVDYSEIDFEILKTPPYCPENIFPPVYKANTPNRNKVKNWNVKLPDDILNTDDQITVACTNWDMACSEPKNYDAGCQPVYYQNKNFEAHRWERNYRALTEKSLEKDDALFKSDFYYFEIDWRPTEIIWRIGHDLKHLRVVGYMNDKVTSIANNQMLFIITQEFHNTQWWPGTPYKQENIPFPSKDMVGEIYDFTIE